MTEYGHAGIRIEQVGLDALPIIRPMNRLIFEEDRIINTFERPDVVILIAWSGPDPVGFKIGYRENRFTFYSAKGGVMPAWRRRGVASALLADMMARVQQMGFTRFAFDTFPNLHPGMTILALRNGFRLVKSDFNTTYREYRLRFEVRLDNPSEEGVNERGEG
ncbi:MAG: GNAT family N-acetyltransferase [Rhodothermales bacterium]